MSLIVSGRIGVWKRGYEWETRPASNVATAQGNVSGDTRFLVPASLSDDQVVTERDFDWYEPFAGEPALFYRFADVHPSSHTILEFANRYGHISPSHAYAAFCTPNKPRIKGSELRQSCRSEFSLSRWKLEIVNMAMAVHRWLDLPRLGGLVTPTKISRDLCNAIPPLSALIGLQEGPDETLQVAASVEGLSNVMWLQFALAIAESKQYRRCEVCQTVFELSPESGGKRRRGRSDKQFCSDNCRVKSYLARRENAKKMRAQGSTLHDIAKKVGTDLDTLKRWLEED